MVNQIIEPLQICKAEVGDWSTSNADGTFSASNKMLPRKVLKREGESKHPCLTRTLILYIQLSMEQIIFSLKYFLVVAQIAA